MSSMNFMEKLLDGVEVECKAMGDVCHVASGGTPSTVKKEYWDNGDIPWLKSESCNNESVYAADNFITELTSAWIAMAFKTITAIWPSKSKPRRSIC